MYMYTYYINIYINIYVYVDRRNVSSFPNNFYFVFIFNNLNRFLVKFALCKDILRHVFSLSVYLFISTFFFFAPFFFLFFFCFKIGNEIIFRKDKNNNDDDSCSWLDGDHPSDCRDKMRIQLNFCNKYVRSVASIKKEKR